MPQDAMEVGVVVARRELKGPWADHAWLPRAVLPAAAGAEPWTVLSEGEGEALFYAGPFSLMLHSGETAHYRDNLQSGAPSLWVALRPGEGRHEVAAVTADPYEGEAMAEGVGEIVEAVPMPAEIQERVRAFFEAHHVERVFVKRKRDRAGPSGRRPAGHAGGLEEPER